MDRDGVDQVIAEGSEFFWEERQWGADDRGGCRVHAAMVEGGQVIPHHQDPVTAGLPRPARGQQPQLPGRRTAEDRSRTPSLA